MNAPLHNPFAEKCDAFLKCPPHIAVSKISVDNPKGNLQRQDLCQYKAIADDPKMGCPAHLHGGKSIPVWSLSARGGHLSGARSAAGTLVQRGVR